MSDTVAGVLRRLIPLRPDLMAEYRDARDAGLTEWGREPDPVECVTCDDGHFVRVPVPDSLVSRLVPCPSCAAQHEEPVDVVLERSGVSDLHGAARLDQWLGAIGDTARRYVETWPPARPWLVLYGPPGRGKTHLAAAVVRAVWERHQVRPLMATAPDLLDRIRATYGDEATEPTERVLTLYREVPLLVVDDLGAERGTEWASERLYTVLDKRYASRQATIITTNRRLQDLDARLASRMGDVRLVTALSFAAEPDRRRGL